MPFSDSIFVRTGRFSNVREIGKGSFGKVYYATDNLGRAVAVKEALPTSALFHEARNRFAKESQLQASLQHPNIVSVYHFEEDPNSREYYLISEYMDGGSLADYLDTRVTLSEQQALKVALDICAALEIVWGAKIVHRDIKPSYLLNNPGERGVRQSDG
jgi:serine/threonine protein kinase